MASYAVTTAKHATLAAGVVDTVTLGKDFDNVEILNRSAVEITFTTDGTNPTVRGDNCYIVPAGGALRVEPDSSSATVVNLIAEATAPYSVSAIGLGRS